MNLSFEIITPDGIIFKDMVDEILVPTVNGEIGILPNHIGLISQVKPGELTIRKGSKTELLAVTDGFLEVANNNASIVANYAVKADNISVAKAEEAKQKAEKLMKEKTTDKDYRIAEAQLRQALLELKIGAKNKRRMS